MHSTAEISVYTWPSAGLLPGMVLTVRPDGSGQIETPGDTLKIDAATVTETLKVDPWQRIT